MRIAQISPLIESVPPKLYGGTERVVSYLTEELVRLGHDVTLFASGDSLTAAELVPCVSRAIRLNPDIRDPLVYLVLMLEKVRSMADSFDILHFHVDYVHFPIFRDLVPRAVTTLHGRQDLPDLPPIYAEFDDMPLISISNHQRAPIQYANWAKTIYHGLPTSLYPMTEKPKDGYLAFLGRIHHEKRPDRAIEIAKRVGIPLKIAAKLDADGLDYYHEVLEPMLDDPLVEFVGEIGEKDKAEFLGNASVVLFPIDWPEPFGLTMIESMACGTPVIAWPNGSVPEIIDHGVTGFHVTSVEEAAAFVPKAMTLDRKRIRGVFEERFSARRMAKDHIALYQELLSEKEPEVKLSKQHFTTSSARKSQAS
ncbi:MAG: glycosyltransferase family 4 protein [Rickettsiales bacterium]